MFVSSFSTYVDTNRSNKIQKQDSKTVEERSKVFSSLLEKKSYLALESSVTKPLNYIQTPTTQYNQQRIQIQQNLLKDSSKSSETAKNLNATKALNAQISSSAAPIAYMDNTQLFSLMKKAHVPLNQTPTIDPKAPKELQDAKENALRSVMIKTYTSNDFYYKITA